MFFEKSFKRRFESFFIGQIVKEGILKIRPYVSGDWNDFLRLDLVTVKKSVRPKDGRKWQKFASEWGSKVRERFNWTDRGPESESHSIYVLENENDGYIGHVWFQQQVDVFSNEKKLYIFEICVDEKYRRQGLGKRLMSKVEESAKERKISRIELAVECDNHEAINLYKDKGYSTNRLTMTKFLAGHPEA